jgi:hypothetical protein
MTDENNVPEIGEEVQFEECCECCNQENLIECDNCGDWVCEKCAKYDEACDESLCSDCWEQRLKEDEMEV